VDGHTIKIILHDVLHMPSASKNLISVSKLDEAGGRAIYGNGKVRLLSPAGNTLAVGTLRNRLYYFDCEPITKEHAYISDEPCARTWADWH
ncbi:hypothetical protein CONPUDRAFT_35622, partial [Coniophora puteana RWD-64-598 SS2]